jgi:hypothetical protein
MLKIIVPLNDFKIFGTSEKNEAPASASFEVLPHCLNVMLVGVE